MQLKPLVDNLVVQGQEVSYPEAKRAHDADSGVDLIVAERTELHPFEPIKVKHKLAVQAKPSHETQIRPRSSSLVKRRVHVALGTIDNHYRGELMSAAMYIPAVKQVEATDAAVDELVEKLIATGDFDPAIKDGEHYRAVRQDFMNFLTLARALGLVSIDFSPLVLEAGEAVSQLVEVSVDLDDPEMVAELTETVRGDAGFGSTDAARQASLKV